MPTFPQPGAAGYADPSATSRSPSTLVFDVNETLIDTDAMRPLFTQILGDPRAMRQWFGQLTRLLSLFGPKCRPRSMKEKCRD